MSMDALSPGFDAYQMASKAPAIARAPDREQAAKIARQFEGQFISQMFQHMFDGIKTDGLFGGGQAEQMFRSVLMDEYGKMIANRGGTSLNGSGFGIAASVQKMLLKHQEVH